MASFLGHNPLHTSLSNLKNTYYASTSIPPRDRVIDFGKYKGKMLGTLPSNYLKWVSNTLRARDFEHWANLADNVLQDPFYKDILEWEFAEKHLNGDDHLLSLNSMSKGGSSVAQLLELSHRFGWDNEDKVGWSKVDFQLLGTSKGGRIPRVKERVCGSCEDGHGRGIKGGGVEKGVRRVRGKGIEQPISRETDSNRKSSHRAIDSNQQPSHRETDSNVQVYNPFPGRESLLKKVLTRRNTIL